MGYPETFDDWVKAKADEMYGEDQDIGERDREEKEIWIWEARSWECLWVDAERAALKRVEILLREKAKEKYGSTISSFIKHLFKSNLFSL